jgi:catalase-peroxidase
MNKTLIHLLILSITMALGSVFAQENAGKSMTSSPVKNTSNQFWWPERLDLSPLRQQSMESNPYGKQFNYAKEFQKLDLNAVKKRHRSNYENITGLVAR